MTTSDLTLLNNPKVDILDLVIPYAMPVLITSLIILVYFIIKYRKFGMLKVTVYTIISIIGTQLLLLSIYSCTRLPINQYTMPISMMVFIVTILVLTEGFERTASKVKQEQK